MNLLRKPKNSIKVILIGVGVLLILSVFTHFGILYCVNGFLLNWKMVAHAPVFEESQKQMSLDLKNVQPFEEVNVLDEDAHSGSTFYSSYGAGHLIFDANADGRLDIYILKDGDNWVRSTDETGLLQAKPRYQHNVLYLNQGNDSAGRPQFQQVKKLATTNNTYVKAELLIENFLFPRESVEDSIERKGRKAQVAVATDLNGDGLVDLLIGNGQPGSIWSHPKTQKILSPMIAPEGRAARKTSLPVSSFANALVQRPVRDETRLKRESARGEEFYGANTLLLNDGDKDQDGIPEWRDVSREAGLEGQRSTVSFAVADFDLDGDLDIYEGNVTDGDYLPGGTTEWAGAANALYLNQLVETGELIFVERAAEMNVDGAFDEDYPMPEFHRLKRVPFLPKEYSFINMQFEKYRPEILEIDGVKGEAAEITWSTVVQDVNEDGYPDLWAANDFGYLRLYLNDRGKKFNSAAHAASKTTGNWMSFSPGDFNGDLKEDLFVGNVGGGLYTTGLIMVDPNVFFEPTLLVGMGSFAIMKRYHRVLHALIDGADYSRELSPKVQHSQVLPPNATLSGNLRFERLIKIMRVSPEYSFKAQSLDPYEFVWGATNFDASNNGRLDLYMHGGLYGRGGGLFALSGTNPGRFLMNQSTEEGLTFSDLTAEHRLFNILGLQYDQLPQGHLYRKAPSQNWQKRDWVYSYDRSSWAFRWPMLKEDIAHQDMIQLAENGRSVVAADLNQDGFEDLILRNVGGYDSRSHEAKNLKVLVNGVPKAIPPHNLHYPTPTNFEPGKTRIFLNTYSKNHYLKVELIDDGPGFNRQAIGAKVIVNRQQMRINRVSQGGFIGNKNEALHFGLGSELVFEIEIAWPDRQRTVTHYALDSLADGLLRIAKGQGIVEWRPARGKG